MLGFEVDDSQRTSFPDHLRLHTYDAHGNVTRLPHLGGVDQVWTSDGWYQRFGLPYLRQAHGFRMTPVEVGAFNVTDTALLNGYAAATWAQTRALLDSLSPERLDEVIDARGQVVIPGLVNTHHHFYQTLTRALRPAQDAELFDWLQREGAIPEAVAQLRRAFELCDGTKASADIAKAVGTSPQSIEIAEDRKLFAAMLNKLNIPQPPNGLATNEAIV